MHIREQILKKSFEIKWKKRNDKWDGSEREREKEREHKALKKIPQLNLLKLHVIWLWMVGVPFEIYTNTAQPSADQHWTVQEIDIQMKREKRKKYSTNFSPASTAHGPRPKKKIFTYVAGCVWICQRFWIRQHYFDLMVIRNLGCRLAMPSNRMCMKFNTQQFCKSQLFLEFYLNNNIFCFCSLSTFRI